MSVVLEKRRTWKRASVKKIQHFVKENTHQKIEKIVHQNKSALLITYKKEITLKDLIFLKRATTYLTKEGLPFSKLLSFDHTKCGYRGTWSYCSGKVKPDWSIKEYAAVGRFLGKMHSSAKKYSVPNLLRPPVILLLREKYEMLKEFLPETFVTLEPVLRTIESRWPIFLPTGLVHTDLFPSNILFKQEEVSGILQNHKIQIDTLLYDLTSVIKTLYFNNTEHLKEKEIAFFKAYTSFHPLSEEEVRAISVLTAAKMLDTTLLLVEKHLNAKEYTDMHLNTAAMNLVYAEKALQLYQ